MLKSTQATPILHVPVSALLGYNLALLPEGLVYLERGNDQKEGDNWKENILGARGCDFSLLLKTLAWSNSIWVVPKLFPKMQVVPLFFDFNKCKEMIDAI